MPMLLVPRLRSCLPSHLYKQRWLTYTPSSSCKPSESYDTLVRNGDLTFDAKQAAIVRRFLDPLHLRLDGYELPTHKSASEEGNGDVQNTAVTVPRGLYIHGGVGTGKSMLLELLFRGAKVQRKRRVHFNAFMLEIQARLGQEKKKQLELYGRQRHIVLDKSRDVVRQVAHSIAEECHLLCFDEFQVTDVADALIMPKLFGVMFVRGTVMVATSNTAPKDLYKEGTNYDYFVPFLKQLSRHTRVVSMDSEVDYRFLYEPLCNDETFLSPLTDATRYKMDAVYQNLLELEDHKGGKQNDGQQEEWLLLPVMLGRALTVRGCVQSGVCRISFRQLCGVEKGAADYKAIAECFHTLVLDNVPALSMAQHDQARRFILLVDELYEHRTRLIVSSEAAEPQEIFLFDYECAASVGGNSSIAIDNEDAAVGVPRTSAWDAPVGAYSPTQMPVLNLGTLVALQDLKIAFRRTVSRLREMQSAHYLAENVRERPERTKCRESVFAIDKCDSSESDR